LVEDRLPRADQERFLAAVRRVSDLSPGDLDSLVPALPAGVVETSVPTGQGIFDHGLKGAAASRSEA
jgi:2-methylcitrate dehydratase